MPRAARPPLPAPIRAGTLLAPPPAATRTALPLTEPSATHRSGIPFRTPSAARGTGSLFAAPAGNAWRWPLDGTPEILRRFSPPPARWLAGHRGVDLAAPPAAPVLAAGAGSVGFAGSVAGRGVVTVNHAGGLRTTYLPVTPAVRPGDPVSAGDLLGTLAPAPPHCLESCLHWGLRDGLTYLDPLLLLTGTRIRLLPYWESEPATAIPAQLPPPATAIPTQLPPPVTAISAQVPTPAATSSALPTGSPNRLPAFLPRSAATPPPGPLALTALAALLLLGFVLRLLRTRARRRRSRGKHAVRPPATRGQHRKEPDRPAPAAKGDN
ncbi:peptidoglycan DD-metalloendopeptidase family protein [Nonomuraea harbinensis]|uniref:Peptidoglycan DD-metalloendopeptidase family protein n=1 Tax=Nonomuraea harbinensis TaxID=1286938 RepID=A0ABW1BVP0_9ACTN|nr:peptidoglycan DD-metalloendopeptidase family protein [Nonomuraea harbinensis]